jgi:hypothetical protein
VIFTCVACEPVHNNSCVSLPKKGWICSHTDQCCVTIESNLTYCDTRLNYFIYVKNNCRLCGTGSFFKCEMTAGVMFPTLMEFEHSE